jgi:hypothetical protein
MSIPDKDALQEVKNRFRQNPWTGEMMEDMFLAEQDNAEAIARFDATPKGKDLQAEVDRQRALYGKPEQPAVEAKPEPKFPNRAAWFEEQLRIRDWSVHDLEDRGGPTYKTSRKIINGEAVSPSVLENLAVVLSNKNNLIVSFRDIPTD